jgi:hypothetical protein
MSDGELVETEEFWADRAKALEADVSSLRQDGARANEQFLEAAADAKHYHAALLEIISTTLPDWQGTARRIARKALSLGDT